jgi:hypothetical protein
LEEIETKLEGYRAEWLKEHPKEEISSTNFPVSLRRLLKEHQQLHTTFESMPKLKVGANRMSLLLFQQTARPPKLPS